MQITKQLEKKARERYGDGVDVQKIYNNLRENAFKALNLVFRYGEPHHFGDPDKVGLVDNAVVEIPDREMNWLMLYVIECFLDDKGNLLRVQNPLKYEDLKDEPVDFLIGIYNANYLKILEKVHFLRNGFEVVKRKDIRDYPVWVDQWECCFFVHVEEQHEENINTEEKERIIEMINLSVCLIMIFTSLISRCDLVIEQYRKEEESRKRYKAKDTKPKRDRRVLH